MERNWWKRYWNPSIFFCFLFKIQYFNRIGNPSLLLLYLFFPVHPDITINPTILFLLNQYGNDPVFDSVRTFIQTAQRTLRNKQIISSLSQTTCCDTCSQSFNKLGTHKRHQRSVLGCYNIARLRYLICLRKNIPFEAHPAIPETSINALEDYLNQLDTR